MGRNPSPVPLRNRHQPIHAPRLPALHLRRRPRLLPSRTRHHQAALRRASHHQLHGPQLSIHGPVGVEPRSRHRVQRLLPRSSRPTRAHQTRTRRRPHPIHRPRQTMDTHGTLHIGRELARPQRIQTATRDGPKLAVHPGPRRRRNPLLPMACSPIRSRKVPLSHPPARRRRLTDIPRSLPTRRNPQGLHRGRSSRKRRGRKGSFAVGLGELLGTGPRMASLHRRQPPRTHPRLLHPAVGRQHHGGLCPPRTRPLAL